MGKSKVNDLPMEDLDDSDDSEREYESTYINTIVHDQFYSKHCN